MYLVLLVFLILGHTMSDWVVQWWQWVIPFIGAQSPEFDQVGSVIERAQPHDSTMYFLAGEHSALAPDRHITMPAHKPLMFPVLNALVASFPTNPLQQLYIELILPSQAQAIFDKDEPHIGTATLDGKPLPINWVTTPIFDLDMPRGHFLSDEIKGYGHARVIAGGYWVFLNGLSPGNHTLEFYGHNSMKYMAGATYHIEVGK